MKRCRGCNHFISPLHAGPCPHCFPSQAPAKPNPDLKRKGWATPYGFADFSEPVTYEEACARLKQAYILFSTKLTAREAVEHFGRVDTANNTE